MRVLLLSDANNPHTQKWVKGLCDSGIEMGLFSLTAADAIIYSQYKVSFLNSSPVNSDLLQKSVVNKISYLKTIKSLRKVIKSFRPDIVHAHYASSYGLLGALAGFHPYVISVWGADVYDFPGQGLLQRLLLKFNLRRADIICSTSHVMEKQTSKYTDKKIHVIPFGVDTNILKKQDAHSPFETGSVVIGTVKTMDEKYGIRYLIEAFNILHIKFPKLPLKLLLVGEGPQRSMLMQMVRDYNLEHCTAFTGKVSHSDIQSYHNMLDIAVYPSVLDSESFGVSVIESSACEKPVVVNRVGGLTEVVDENVTGFVVSPKNSITLANAIEKLVLNPELRAQMGAAGRKKIQQNYEWKNCIDKMLEVYKQALRN